MKVQDRNILVCDCEKTMTIDADPMTKALGADAPPFVHSYLCRAQAESFTDSLKDGEPVMVCCTQEAPLFRELAEESGSETDIRFVNIRERAGWSEETTSATPKMAALIAEAALDTAPARSLTLSSQGVCLVYGEGQNALDIASRLSGRLSVSVLLTTSDDAIPPAVVDVPVYKGEIAAAAGHFGAFEIVVNGYAPVVPSSRQQLDFTTPRDGAASTCDIIIDVSGRAPLFPQSDRRDGYFRADPADRAAIAEILFEATDMVGEFEKPLYVDYDGHICAHARNQKTGCTRCLDACPVSAISPDGDTVKINPAICGGCGSCASVCPSGAVSYAMPSRTGIIDRLKALLTTFRTAGGKDAEIVIHDAGHGDQMISALARFGRGLPAHVIPLSVNEVTAIGHESLLTALTLGAQRIWLLIDPKRRDEITGLEEQVSLARMLMSGMGYDGAEARLSIIDEQDPDAVEALLWQKQDLELLSAHDFIGSNNKRQVARTALWLLNAQAPDPQEIIALEAGAPYGRIKIDTDGCTMCLACTSACPMGAIRDNPELPQVRFVEQDCVQCGLCVSTCPEGVISLEARFNLGNDAMSLVTLNEEEPAECVRCGKPFGSKGTIERIAKQLAGKHYMFKSKDAQELIRMCDTCRIEVQADSMPDPFAMGERPQVRVTEDYLDGKADSDDDT